MDEKLAFKIWKIDKNRENNCNFMVYGNQKSDGQLLR